MRIIERSEELVVTERDYIKFTMVNNISAKKGRKKVRDYYGCIRNSSLS